MIADLRRANLSFPVDQYYKATAPAVAEIARGIVLFQARNPNSPIALTKRDIAESFRLLRLQPALCLVMLTELPGRVFGADEEADAVLIYLSIPFGWDGPLPNLRCLGARRP